MFRRLILAAQLIAAPLAAQVSATPHDRLFALFQASDEASLRRNPLEALLRGDPRYADRLGDFYTDAHEATERAAAKADLDRLHAIDRASLNATDRIAYDVFEWRTRIDLRAYDDPALAAAFRVQPINHFAGLHISYPTIASGQGAAPFRRVADYENNLKRHADYVRALDQAIVRFRQGMQAGIVESKLTVRNMIAQFDLQIAQGVAGSTFYAPVKAFPAGIDPSTRRGFVLPMRRSSAIASCRPTVGCAISCAIATCPQHARARGSSSRRAARTSTII